MPRWRQDSKTGKLIPIDEAAIRRDAGAPAVGSFESFASPVDGSIIRNSRQLADHNKRNNVVNAAEFTPEFYAEKAKERERFYNREFTPAEKLQRKQQIYEAITRAERNG